MLSRNLQFREESIKLNPSKSREPTPGCCYGNSFPFARANADSKVHMGKPNPSLPKENPSSKACVVYLRAKGKNFQRDERPREEKSKYSLRSVSMISRPHLQALNDGNKTSKILLAEKHQTVTQWFADTSSVNTPDIKNKLEMKENVSIPQSATKYRRTPGRMRGGLMRHSLTVASNAATDSSYDSFQMDLQAAGSQRLCSTPTRAIRSKRGPYSKRCISSTFSMPKTGLIRAPRCRIGRVYRSSRGRRPRMRGMLRTIQRAKFPLFFPREKENDELMLKAGEKEKTQSLIQVMFNLPQVYTDVILEYCDFKLTETMLMIKHLLHGGETTFAKSFALVKHHVDICLQPLNTCNCWFGNQLTEQPIESEINSEAPAVEPTLSSTNDGSTNEYPRETLQSVTYEELTCLHTPLLSLRKRNLKDEETFGSVFRKACEVLWGSPFDYV